MINNIPFFIILIINMTFSIDYFNVIQINYIFNSIQKQNFFYEIKFSCFYTTALYKAIEKENIEIASLLINETKINPKIKIVLISFF